jgi:hypothetical protein
MGRGPRLTRGGATGGGCTANDLDQDALPEARDMRWSIPSAPAKVQNGSLFVTAHADRVALLCLRRSW